MFDALETQHYQQRQNDVFAKHARVKAKPRASPKPPTLTRHAGLLLFSQYDYVARLVDLLGCCRNSVKAYIWNPRKPPPHHLLTLAKALREKAADALTLAAQAEFEAQEALKVPRRKAGHLHALRQANPAITKKNKATLTEVDL